MASHEFPHLHLHTTHSHLDGYGTPEQFYEHAAKMNIKAMAHTEHGNISSWPQAQKQGKDKGIKPIFGIEAYVVPDHTERSKGYNHITILAADQIGLRNLFDLVSVSFNEGFYYKPRMSWRDILRKGEGLILLSGCWSGFAARHIVTTIRNPTAEVAGVPTKKQVDDWIRTMSRKFPGRFYMELMPLQVGIQKDVLNFELELAARLKIPFVATNDVHYICDGQEDIQDDLVCIRSNAAKDETERRKYDVRELYIKTKAQMADGFKKLGLDDSTIRVAIENAYDIADRCNAVVPAAKPVVYRIGAEIDKSHPVHSWGVDWPESVNAPPGVPTDSELVFGAALRRMWKLRNIPYTKKYKDRAKYEYDLLKAKKFLDYILIIWDLINAAKERPESEGGPILVGPARGSAAGSLICYILGITEVDPFYDDLIFERFVDHTRTDPPDIDIDFPDDQRDWVKGYLQRRWGGPAHVGTLISHAVFKGKNALDDISRVYRVPRWATERIKALLIERSSGDARATFTLEDTFKEFPEAAEIARRYPQLMLSQRLEGQIRHQGTHAAGVIVSTEEPLDRIGAFYQDGAFWVDKKDGEKLEHLKIDLLGLNTLTVLREAAKNIGLSGKDILDFYYNRIPMDDPKVIQAFGRSEVDGIFQFEGQAQMLVCRQLSPKSYKHVRDCTALSRPGPLHCGGTEAYVKRANGEPYDVELELLEPIVADTYGKILYQEQVMQILDKIGHLVWEDIQQLRRLIAKSVGVEYFNKYRDRFMEGATKKSGVDPAVAAAIWDEMCTFGSWAFNRAHAASYTRLSVWTMYMKIYHPDAFLAALAGYSSSEDRKGKAVRLFHRTRGPILSVDINASKAKFSLERISYRDKSGLKEFGLRPGLSDIKGVGEKAAEAILSIREKDGPFKSVTDFISRVPGRIVNRRVRKVLHLLGAFNSLLDKSGVEADKVACETAEYAKTFKTYRAMVSNHCFWVLPVDFPGLRRQLKGLKPLKEIQDTGSVQRNVGFVGRVRHINQRDYRELGSEDKLAKLKPGEETRFINLTIEDEEDFIMTTVPRRNYGRLKNTVFKYVKEGTVIYGRGSILPDGRRIFIDELYAVEEK